MTPEPQPREEMRRSLAALRLQRSTTSTPRRRSRRRLVLAIVGVVLVAVFAVRVLGRSAPTVEVVSATVTPAGASEGVPVLSGAGYVVSADRYISIGVRVAGRIDRYLVEEGDHVKEGDPLVQLDAREYEAAVQRSEAMLRVERANTKLAQAQLTRVETLVGRGIVSREEYDVKRAEADRATARVRQTEAELEQAKVALEYTTLRAPRSGVILAKYKEVGEIAVPGGFSGSGDLIRMANLQDLRGQVDVTESELAKLRLGQRAELVPDAYGDRRYAAHVVKLYPQVDRQKGTLRVEVQIEEPDDRLWPDMSARITFLEPAVGGAGGAVLIPQSAVRTDDQGSFAWVFHDGRVQRTAITTGPSFADQVQITSGLTGQEQVVTGEALGLKDRQSVQVGGR